MARAFAVWVGAVVAAVLAACGGSAGGQPAKHAAVVRVGQGPAVAIAGGTPSDGAVQLALYIDAGSRDGAAPYVAAVAAELLAQSVGRGARAQAFPDGLEVITVCDDGVRACAKRLARGLALRAPSDAAIARVLAKLKEAERTVRGRDLARSADELAVRALWPEDAAQFLPLELRSVASDKRAFDGVRAFIAGAFGPSRALVAVNGPIELAEVVKAIESAFEQAPRANDARAARGLPSNEAGAALLTGVDAGAALSFALRASDVATATRAANALRDELLRSKLVREVTGHASSLRGGGLAVVRVHAASADFAAIVSRAGYAVERMRLEGVGSAQLPLPRDAPAAALRRLGLQFIAGPAPDASDTDISLGAGVLVRGARADRVSAQDPDAALRESERARLTEALRGGAALARPQLDGELGEHTVSAVLPNRSRIAVQVVPADQVAIAVRLGAGALSDPPAQHGRAALLASAMTVACAGRSPAALRAELSSLGATLEPAVTASTLGITLRARAEQAPAAIALAVECALAPSLARGDVTRARLQLRERLGFAPRDAVLPRGGAELRAQVARLLSADRTPGALAPWGAMSTLASVDERALSELLDSALRGPSTSVAITGALGALNAEAAAQLAARRMTRLAGEPAQAVKALAAKPAKRAPAATTARAKPTGKQPRSPLPPQAVEALLVWSAPCSSDARANDASLTTTQDAARAFAAAMSATLSSAELHVPWLDGDCAGGLAWAALLVRGTPERIAAIQAAATRAAALIAPKSALEAANHTARKRLGEAESVAGHAEALAEAPWTPAPPLGTATPAGAGAAAALISRLRAASVRALPVD